MGDGIFWMSFADFLKSYDVLELCRYFDDYQQLCYTSQWSIANRTAGGCGNYDTVGQNPQVAVTVTSPAEIFCVL